MWLKVGEIDWMPIFGSWQRVTVRLSCEYALWEWPLRCWCSWWVPTGKVCYTVAWRCGGLDSFEAPSGRIQWWLHLRKLLYIPILSNFVDLQASTYLSICITMVTWDNFFKSHPNLTCELSPTSTIFSRLFVGEPRCDASSWLCRTCFQTIASLVWECIVHGYMFFVFCEEGDAWCHPGIHVWIQWFGQCFKIFEKMPRKGPRKTSRCHFWAKN